MPIQWGVWNISAEGKLCTFLEKKIIVFSDLLWWSINKLYFCRKEKNVTYSIWVKMLLSFFLPVYQCVCLSVFFSIQSSFSEIETEVSVKRESTVYILLVSLSKTHLRNMSHQSGRQWFVRHSSRLPHPISRNTSLYPAPLREWWRLLPNRLQTRAWLL